MELDASTRWLLPGVPTSTSAAVAVLVGSGSPLEDQPEAVSSFPAVPSSRPEAKADDPHVHSSLSISELDSRPDQELAAIIRDRFDKETPDEAQRKVLLLAHHERGHFGGEALFKSIWHAGYFWPRMRQSCNDHVATCMACLKFNVGKTGFAPQKSIFASLPCQHVSVDTIVQSLPKTERGNVCIVVITCLCTRYRYIKPQVSQDAASTARTLWEFICLFPLPLVIQSDNGTEYVNDLVKNLLSLVGVQHRTVAPYNPRANGTAENSVGQVQKVLRKITGGDLTDWDLFLPAVALALNTHANRSTKSSPSSLLFGVPVGDFASYNRVQDRQLDSNEMNLRIRQLVEVVRPEAQAAFKKAQAKSRAANAKHRRTTPALLVGAKVMLRNPVRSSKHDPPWTGPFTVVRQTQGGSYQLQGASLELLQRTVPRDQLKLIEGDVELADVFTVEKILQHRGNGLSREYFIKWLGYSDEHNTWEPAKNLLSCEQLLSAYWKRA